MKPYRWISEKRPDGKGAACFLLLLPALLLFSTALMAQQGGSVEGRSASQYSYRFFDPVTGRPMAPGEGAEAATEQVPLGPKESAEEREARENIRNVLRLLDGDTVQVDREIHIRLVGVDFPHFKNYQGNRQYERFALQVKDWIDDFVRDPAAALKKYNRMNGPVSYRSAEGQVFSFYYLYVPDILLEEIRKHELQRYDEWVKTYRDLQSKESPRQKSARAVADLGQPIHGDAGTPSSDRLKDVKEYVISEAKYYYEDGSIKREEIYRDGKLIIKRSFSPQGEMLDERFFDESARLYSPAKEALP